MEDLEDFGQECDKLICQLETIIKDKDLILGLGALEILLATQIGASMNADEARKYMKASIGRISKIVENIIETRRGSN